MKHHLRIFLFSSVLLVLFASCVKEENKVFLEGGTAPVLTANRTGSIPLSFNTEGQEALQISWTNPSYQFTTGTSSHNVSYRIEIDTVGANFGSANRKVLTVANELSMKFTQSELNDYLLNQLQLTPGRNYQLEMRVTSSLANNAASLHSNVLRFAATPYAIPPKVAPPASGQLYIVGSATAGGWNNPVPVPAQRFTKVSDTFYEITLPLTGGGMYLFLPVNGDWSAKYGAIGGNGSNDPNGDDFRSQGGDLVAPAASGNYRIQVDFQRGKFTVTRL